MRGRRERRRAAKRGEARLVDLAELRADPDRAGASKPP